MLGTRFFAASVVALAALGCRAATRDDAIERALSWDLETKYVSTMDELCFDGSVRVVGTTTLLRSGHCAIKLTTVEEPSCSRSASPPLPPRRATSSPCPATPRSR